MLLEHSPGVILVMFLSNNNNISFHQFVVRTLHVWTIKFVIIHCCWLVLCSSFRFGQGTHQRPFCLANSLGILPKVPFTKKMMASNLSIPNWLVLRSLFCPSQGIYQRPICLAKSLGVVPKVLFANVMMTAISPSIA